MISTKQKPKLKLRIQKKNPDYNYRKPSIKSLRDFTQPSAVLSERFTKHNTDYRKHYKKFEVLKMKEEDKQTIIRIAIEDLIKNLTPRFNDFLFYNSKQNEKK